MEHWRAGNLLERFHQPFQIGIRVEDVGREAKGVGSCASQTEVVGREAGAYGVAVAVAKRSGRAWVSSVRSELLSHVVVFNEAHLRQLLAEYVAYDNIDRCHLAQDKDAPDLRQTGRRPTASAMVVALPRVGGIHHRYEWRDFPRIAA